MHLGNLEKLGQSPTSGQTHKGSIPESSTLNFASNEVLIKSKVYLRMELYLLKLHQSLLNDDESGYTRSNIVFNSKF